MVVVWISELKEWERRMLDGMVQRLADLLHPAFELVRVPVGYMSVEFEQMSARSQAQVL